MANFLTARTPSKLTTIISLIALFVFMPLLVYGTSQVAILLTRASGKPANIVVDTKDILEPIQTDFYHAFAQGGEEGGDMLDDILPELKALKPQLVRLDHIYDHYDVVSGSKNGGMTYNWANLDAAVNTILASGAKPVLALSYMPPVISKDGSLISPPENWSDWAAVVQKTIEHYSGKNEKNINGIYYEVWNEPDLGQFGSWKRSGEKNYLTLYHYSAVGAAAAQNVNTFYLGGPSTTGLYQAWILDLIKSGNRIDFLSWHTYQFDPERFDQDQRNLNKWLLPYPRSSLLPKLITEAGFTGDKSPLYGGVFAAAHAAAMVRQLMSNGVDYVFTFQPKDGPGQAQTGNGWGFVTHEDNGKKLKPRYHIFSFLDQMAGDRLTVSGEGTWVTGYASRKENTIRLLLVNFDTKGTHTETVPIKFTNLDPGTYQYRQKFFLSTDVKLTETVPVDTLEKKILMAPSSIVLLELTKQ